MMKLEVYKGFGIAFLKDLHKKPLVNGDMVSKIDVLSFDKKTSKELKRALLDLEESDEAWVTYQEYSLIKNNVDNAMAEDGLEIVIYRNNLFPDYYPIEFDLTDELANEIEKCLDGQLDTFSDECEKFHKVYSGLVQVEGKYYGSFFNYEYEYENEYEKIDQITISNFYLSGEMSDIAGEAEFKIYINDNDIKTYLRDLAYIADATPKAVGIQTTDSEVSHRILDSFLAYCRHHEIRAFRYHESLEKDTADETELIHIAQEDIGIKDFKGFRTIPFYKHPDINKEVMKISQGQIIREIIQQAEKAHDVAQAKNGENDKNDKTFRDIFITASTGAGKSVMFQIPAVYLAKKYNKLTIIIEPIKALMQDQMERLKRNGYNRVEAFNSDLITQAEKEAVLQRIRDGEVDLLYLSPETLLSYSIETIIGDREIGLLIVDEAHVVTTWGEGFRPDYWYLGTYINRLRNRIQVSRSVKRKIYHFPVCAFTATAIFGRTGSIDNDVEEISTSLNMIYPIMHIGYTKREDIEFKIDIKSQSKLSKKDYEAKKTSDLDTHLQQWLAGKEKTVVYFPYATLARDAKEGLRGFAGITVDDENIGIYTGRDVYDLGTEEFNKQRREAFERFRDGTSTIMYATKAFGMGVSVNDIKNVYHYAAPGNLRDYVQEIGRAARKESMNGYAITDFYPNDLKYIKTLFYMSQIKQPQIKKVLECIYEAYKNNENKKNSKDNKTRKDTRNFLISPEAFTYIFGSKDSKDSDYINKLKTCLLMLEKDLDAEFGYKVLISRPRSVFTKAFVVIDREHLEEVLKSKYGKCFNFEQKGRNGESLRNGVIYDIGDVYSVDLKKIWEDFYPNISFPQFKYYYFNQQAEDENNVRIMPEIRAYLFPRQQVSIEASKDYSLRDVRNKILDDFKFVAKVLYKEFGMNKYFSINDFAKLLSERYGITKAHMIANVLFELIDPAHEHVRYRAADSKYRLVTGYFEQHMRGSINRSNVVTSFSNEDGKSYSAYVDLANDITARSLKILSVFGYISYEIIGGQEPEIFIRLNNPDIIKNIVTGKIFYFNKYIVKASQKHYRDVEILSRFFTELSTDEERWNYIEDYFLGYDVLLKKTQHAEAVEMERSVDKKHSYKTDKIKADKIDNWSGIYTFIDDGYHKFLKKLEENKVPKPEYIETLIKNSSLGKFILMSWPSKNTLICNHETPDSVMQNYAAMGWHAYRVSEIDYDQISKDLK